MQFSVRVANVWRVGLVVSAVVVSFLAGVSPLAGYSPLIAGGMIVAVAGAAVLLQKPTWALYAAVFVLLLPSARGATPLAQVLDRLQSLLNRSVTLIALASWLLSLSSQRRRIVWTPTALWMLGFLWWGVVTLIWAPDRGRGMEQIGQYALRWILFLLLIANQIKTPKELDGLMRTLAFNGCVLVLAGVGAILSQGYEPRTSLQIMGMNQNEIGSKMVMTMPGVLWQVMQAPERQKALRMVLSLAFLLLTVVLVALTGSRGSAIAVLAVLLAYWFWKPTRPWGKLALFILAVAVIIAPFIFSTLMDRFLQVKVLEAEAGPLGGRLLIWRASWLIVGGHPVGGVGIGNANNVLASYLHRITRYFQHHESIVSHNAILQVWTETGTIGVSLYLGVLASAVWLFARQYYRHSKLGGHSLSPYFALVSCTFVGIMLTWLKDGGAAYDPTYFLLLALLLVPLYLEDADMERITRNRIQDVGATGHELQT
jgi:O-antigen ligase